MRNGFKAPTESLDDLEAFRQAMAEEQEADEMLKVMAEEEILYEIFEEEDGAQG